MRKEFNITGNCVSSRHFMVDTSHKLTQVFNLIERGKYFTINRPRQFGKTTTIYLMNSILDTKEDYLVIDLTFEACDDTMFDSYKAFTIEFLYLIKRYFEEVGNKKWADYFTEKLKEQSQLASLEEILIDFIKTTQKRVVLIIDEVDQASNYIVFLKFLGMLRKNYLKQNSNRVQFFQSVILAGVTDIKHLKSKIRNDGENTINSPWNIAADFKVDLSFSAPEIAGMLNQYIAETGYNMDSTSIAERIYYYTSGYPYLVSAMCKHIDEEILPQRENKAWTLEDVEASFKMLVRRDYSNYLFEEMIKNIFRYQDLYDLLVDIIINGLQIEFLITRPVISLAVTYGIIKANDEGFCILHNLIFDKKFSDMMLGEKAQENRIPIAHPVYHTNDGNLDLKLALQAFQKFMKENYSQKDEVFLENHGRLLFLSFLRPVINGTGFSFKEPVVGNERRMDVVITYNHERFVLELKRWLGESYHQKGLQQLSDYLDLYNLKEGFLLIYDFRKEKVYKEEMITINDKEIFMVWV